MSAPVVFMVPTVPGICVYGGGADRARFCVIMVSTVPGICVVVVPSVPGICVIMVPIVPGCVLWWCRL